MATFEDRPINFNLLHKDELEYEVELRGGKPAPTVTELRSQIRKLNIELSSDEVTEFSGDCEREFATICEKLESLQSLLVGTTQRPCSLKILSRVQALAYHLYHRLSRLQPLEGAGDKFFETNATIEKIIDRLESIMLNFRSSRVASPTPVREVIPEKYQAVHTLNIKFDGKSCVKGFLQRLEEVRVSRGISDERLFKSAPELFTDGALCWYRGAISDVHTWSELKNLLLAEYLPFDFDFRLMKEIRERTQGQDESIVNYLSVMQNYFSQLLKPITEIEKLAIVRHNIRPFYTTQLALHPINSWSDLKSSCRLLEQAECIARSFSEPTTSASILASDLIYTCDNGKATAGQVSAIQEPSRKLFCYRCGEPDVVTSTCPKCKMSKN